MKHRHLLPFTFGFLILIAVIATILTVLNNDDKYAGLIYSIVMLYGVGVEVVVLLLLGLFHLLKGQIFKRDPGKMPVKDEAWQAQQQKRRELGKAYLLNAGLVLLIGFSACLGGAYLMVEML